MLWSEILRKASSLQDNRTAGERAAAMRNLVPVAGPDPVEQEAARLRQVVRDEKRSKMTPAQRQLAAAEDYLERRDAPPAEPDKPSPKQAKVQALIEKIVNDPTRPRADYEAAMQVYEQLGPGMDHAVGAEWFDELAQQQQKYLLAKQGELVRQRQALQQQAEQLTAQMGEFVPSASLVEKRIGLLNGYIDNSGQPLPPGISRESVVAAREALAAGDSSAAVDLITQAASTIDSWEASIAEAS